MQSKFLMPIALQPFVCVTEVAEGATLCDTLFWRKFGHSAPNYGRHVIAFVRDEFDTWIPASYLNCWQNERSAFIGGGCTDGRALARLSAIQRQLVNAEGGLLRQTLRYSFQHFASEIDAFFGHCGNARAKEVDLAAGFQETKDAYLLVRWVANLSQTRKDELVARTLAMGTF